MANDSGSSEVSLPLRSGSEDSLSSLTIASWNSLSPEREAVVKPRGRRHGRLSIVDSESEGEGDVVSASVSPAVGWKVRASNDSPLSSPSFEKRLTLSERNDVLFSGASRRLFQGEGNSRCSPDVVHMSPVTPLQDSPLMTPFSCRITPPSKKASPNNVCTPSFGDLIEPLDKHETASDKECDAIVDMYTHMHLLVPEKVDVANKKVPQGEPDIDTVGQSLLAWKQKGGTTSGYKRARERQQKGALSDRTNTVRGGGKRAKKTKEAPVKSKIVAPRKDKVVKKKTRKPAAKRAKPESDDDSDYDANKALEHLVQKGSNTHLEGAKGQFWANTSFDLAFDGNNDLMDIADFEPRMPATSTTEKAVKHCLQAIPD